MAIGTAGYTAMLSVLALEHGGLTPQRGDILVPGANGGVGSIAIEILSDLGYRVVASTERLEESDYLRSLGAAEIMERRTLSDPGAPIASERWAGAVDSVGSRTLANVLAQTKYRGVVTACGLAQGADLPASVLPFILRNVTLAGIDSVNAPQEARIQAWSRLARDLDLSKLARTTQVVGLAEVARRSRPDVRRESPGPHSRRRQCVTVLGRRVRRLWCAYCSCAHELSRRKATLDLRQESYMNTTTVAHLGRSGVAAEQITCHQHCVHPRSYARWRERVHARMRPALCE